jgi:lipopolysaccharide/colanic/teichoic acid biosynthesis glycosyltransferase
MHLKRAFDIAASATALVLLAPVFVLIAVAIVIECGFPVFYTQERIGRDFRPFRIWKFRSMRAGTGGPRITVRGDRRVTAVGRFLRANKLDELPQLWNVLIGDMSLVGPRPELPEYVDLYRERYRTILTTRPGLTDLASVRFCEEENVLAAAYAPAEYYANRLLPAKLDLAEEYLQKRSFWYDLFILVRTASAVLRAG